MACVDLPGNRSGADLGQKNLSDLIIDLKTYQYCWKVIKIPSFVFFMYSKYYT